MNNFYSRSEKILGKLNIILLGLFALSTTYPFIYVLSSSLSSGAAVASGRVIFFPTELTLSAYKQIFSDKLLWTSYANTFFYTIFGTAISMIFTITGAYALSKPRLIGRKFLNLFIAFTMWFSAGMIPFYLNLRDLGLLNSRLGVLIAFACNSFNIILLRNYFERGIPETLEEAAKVDGATEFDIMTRIYIPLSKSALTTVALFYAIARWNGYFWSMVLLKDESKIPLQVYLKKMVVEMSLGDEVTEMALQSGSHSPETLVYAIIVLAIIPVIAIYPFIQKYFNKGIMMGGVKE